MTLKVKLIFSLIHLLTGVIFCWSVGLYWISLRSDIFVFGGGLLLVFSTLGGIYVVNRIIQKF